MKDSIISKLDSLSERHEELQALLGDASVISDQVKFRAYSKEYSQLEEVVGTFNRWKKLNNDIEEALPTIIDNVTVLIVNLIGYSAMAGAIGGGGLGDIAIRYGYQRFQADIMIATIIILIVLVQVVQMIGDAWSKAMNKK